MAQENKPLAPVTPNNPPPALADSNFVRSAYYAVGPAVANPEAGGPVATMQGPTFAGLVRAFRRRWLLATAASILGAGLIVAAIFFLIPMKYRASVRFLLNKGDESELAVVKSNQSALIKSPPVIRTALEQKVNGKDIKNLSILRAHADPVEWLESNLKVEFPSVEVMRVSLAADRADETADLLNALAKALIDENEVRDGLVRQKKIEALEQAKLGLDKEILQKQTQLDNQTRSIDEKQREDAIRQAQDAVRDAQKTYRETETKLEVTKGILEGMSNRLKNMDLLPAPTDKIDELLRSDPRAAPYYQLVAKIQQDIADTKRVATGNVSALIASKEAERDRYLKEIAKVRASLLPELEQRARDAEVSKMKARIFELKDEVQTLEQLTRRFQEQVTRAKEEEKTIVATALQVPPHVKNLRDSIENIKSSRNAIHKQMVDVANAYQVPRVSIQSPASEPSGKDSSRQMKLAGAGGLGFFFLILFGVTYLEFRSGKVGEAEELTGTGISLVGTIPNLPLSARAPVGTGSTPRDLFWQNRLAESVDSIRTLLLHVSRTDSLRVIMVTSAVSGEGKTSLASQLAASLSRAWRKTLLIDGDLRNPASHGLFNLSLEPGLSEVLRGEVKANDAIKPTPLSRLWVMPAGHWDAHAIQALAQDSVRTLLEQLKQQYDFIIIDSCPVLPVADSLVMGQHVDGVLFSVLREVSRLPALHQAHQKMTNLGIRTLGAVVLGTTNDVGASNYKYTGAAKG